MTGQALGDGLAPWCHPTEVVGDFSDGTGWPADVIADEWLEGTRCLSNLLDSSR